MAGKTEQGGGDENHGNHDEPEIGLVRHQHIHRQCAKAEIDDPDQDLQQRQRSAWQHHRPGTTADQPGPRRNPGHIADQAQNDDESDQPVQPGRQLIDRGSCLRMIGDAEPKHRGIAKPEGQPGQKADLGHVDRVHPPVGVDAVTYRTPAKDAGADIVADRIAGEGSKRIDAVGDVAAADRADCKQIVERQGEIAGSDEQGGEGDRVRFGSPDGLDDLFDIQASQHVVKHIAGNADDGDADRNTKLMQDLLLAQNRYRPAYCSQHLDLELRSCRVACEPRLCHVLPVGGGSAF